MFFYQMFAMPYNLIRVLKQNYISFNIKKVRGRYIAGVMSMPDCCLSIKRKARALSLLRAPAR